MPLALKTAMDGVSADVDQMFDRLLAVPSDPRKTLYEAMRHAAIGGGKRLRPLLVRASSDLFHVDRVPALRVGVAIECIHVYSLIHDDLPCMDDDDLRRGKPTVHKAFDEATAVLAGDALQALAFELIADPETHADPSCGSSFCPNWLRRPVLRAWPEGRRWISPPKPPPISISPR